jgi:hypothetical protein
VAISFKKAHSPEDCQYFVTDHSNSIVQLNHGGDHRGNGAELFDVTPNNDANGRCLAIKFGVRTKTSGGMDFYDWYIIKQRGKKGSVPRSCPKSL